MNNDTDSPRRSVRPHAPVTSAQAAELLNVPRKRTAQWVSDGLVHPRGFIRGRGRNGRVPLFDLAAFQPLADAYHARRDTPTRTTCHTHTDQRE